MNAYKKWEKNKLIFLKQGVGFPSRGNIGILLINNWVRIIEIEELLLRLSLWLSFYCVSFFLFYLFPMAWS